MNQVFPDQTIQRVVAASACIQNTDVNAAKPTEHRLGQSRRMSQGPVGQRGVALVVALILLLVITLVGLAAVSGTIMQQKMTSNFYDRQIAFQATEGALRQGEIAVGAMPASTSSSFIPGSPVRNCSDNSGNHCLANPFTDPSPSPAVAPTTVSGFNAGALAAVQPQYVIEYMGYFPAPPDTVKNLTPNSTSTKHHAGFYRITARSGDPTNANATNRASVTLQSVFRH